MSLYNAVRQKQIQFNVRQLDFKDFPSHLLDGLTRRTLDYTRESHAAWNSDRSLKERPNAVQFALVVICYTFSPQSLPFLCTEEEPCAIQSHRRQQRREGMKDGWKRCYPKP